MSIKIVDEAALEIDVEYRFRYVRDFVGLTSSDVEAVRESSHLLREKMPQLADALLTKLLETDESMRFFVPTDEARNSRRSANSQNLTQDHPRVLQIRQNVIQFLDELVSGQYDDPAFAFALDKIGATHARADRADAKVPMTQINAMMGFLSDRLIAKARSLGLPHDREIALITALQKLIWIQMNMMVRHYVR
ncbi:hypothetical protein GC170_21025 [bacterium]|nr:hypothetical protein [bacterium]